MVTLCVAGMILGGCAAARRYLDRSSCRETELAGGRVRLTALWNRGAAFGLPVKAEALRVVSAALLGLLWMMRRAHPVSAGLVLGGGLSNLLERALHGRVYDYLQFPKAPWKLKRYVYNLADLAIFLGCAGLLGKRK